MTDLCGLKPQFDREGAGDGNFFLFSMMVSDEVLGAIVGEVM